MIIVRAAGLSYCWLLWAPLFGAVPSCPWQSWVLSLALTDVGMELFLSLASCLALRPREALPTVISVHPVMLTGPLGFP